MLAKLNRITIGIIRTHAIQQWLVRRHRLRIQELLPPQCIQLILLTIIIKVFMKQRTHHMHHIHSLFIPLVSRFYHSPQFLRRRYRLQFSHQWSRCSSSTVNRVFKTSPVRRTNLFKLATLFKQRRKFNLPKSLKIAFWQIQKLNKTLFSCTWPILLPENVPNCYTTNFYAVKSWSMIFYMMHII